MTSQVENKNYESTIVGASTGSSSNVKNDSSAKTKSPNSVVKQQNDLESKTGDNVVLSKHNKVTPEIEAKLAETEKKYQELGFKGGFKIRVLQRIGYSENLEPEKQISILNALNNILDYYISAKKNNKIIAKGYNILQALTLTAANYIKELENGSVESFEEFQQMSRVDNKGFKKAKTHKQKSDAIKSEKENIINRINRRRAAKLKQCTTDEERARVNERYDNLIKTIVSQAMLSQIEQNSQEEAKYSVYYEPAEKQSEAHKFVIGAFEPEEQKNVADSFTHEFETKLLQTFYENGDPISADEYKNIISTIMQYKSEEGAEQFKADANAYNKENNDTPWYTKEHAQAEKNGIKTGISSNSNINTNTTNNESNDNSSTYISYNDNQITTVTVNKNNKDLNNKESIEKQDNKTNTDKNNNSTTKNIALSIKTGNMTMLEAINTYHEKGFDAIFEDAELFARNKALAAIHVNNFRNDLDKLLELSNFSSAIELIAKNISPTIKDKYTKEVKISAVTKDAIFGKEENNAAA